MTCLNLTSADIAALVNVEPCQLSLLPSVAFQLLATIQLASRHPGAAQSGAMQQSVAIARALQKHLSVTPNLRALCEAGWNPAHDVPSEGKDANKRAGKPPSAGP